jgi:hypothetical protein
MSANSWIQPACAYDLKQIEDLFLHIMTSARGQFLDVALWQRGLLVVKSDWLIKNLRQDPRYTELLKKMHLSR